MKKQRNIHKVLGSKIQSPLDEVIGGLAGCSQACDNPKTQCQCLGQQQQQLPSESDSQPNNN